MDGMGFVLGLGGPYYHDASACLVDDAGTILAFAEEERFTRRKHNRNSRSCARAAAYCLSQAGLRLQDIDEIAVAWNPGWPEPADYITNPDLICELLDPRYFRGYVPRRLAIFDHHLTHAASAFYTSGFTESAVLVVDGSGDGLSTSLFHGRSTGLSPLRQYPFSQSLGWFFETVAEHLGFDGLTGSGKLMGLAAYGKPIYAFDFLKIGQDGDYLIDLSRYGLRPSDGVSGKYANLEYYRSLKRAYRSAFADLGVPLCRQDRHYDPNTGRDTSGFEFDPDQLNLAASAQHVMESCLLQLARTVLSQTGSSHLCIAGGVGLNCSANGALLRHSGAKHLFVQPAAGDAGCAIGAALECVRRRKGLAIPNTSLSDIALGPSFSDEAIATTLDTLQIDYTYHGDDVSNVAARSIASGSVVGWFQGPCEGGPRALGHRSILADPRTTASRDRINRDIKRREMWRPLAPSILASVAHKFIVDARPSPFMIVGFRATEDAQTGIPATVHVDGSVRPQTVDPIVDPRFARVLSAFAAETDVAALLNTSFNCETEPIVCTPTDALRTFFSTPLDAMALGGFYMTKRPDVRNSIPSSSQTISVEEPGKNSVD
jgi:carbamoyltransferase